MAEAKVSPVRESLELFISRIAKGNGSDGEVTVFPSVVALYREMFDGGVEESAPLDAGGFPAGDSLVCAKEAAAFLGFTRTNKFPEKAVIRLSNEGKLPQAIKVGDKTLRWKACWIRDFKRSLEVGAENGTERV